MKKVLIIILNYKTYKMTIDLVEQLKTLDDNLFDIMIIDNNSPNESALILERFAKDKGLIFFKNNINSGYAAGNNIGIRYATNKGYQYSLILNNDLKIVDSEFIEKLIIAGSDESVACIGPKIVDLDGESVAPYCNRPSFYSLTLGIKREKTLRAKRINKSGKVYRLFGCCMLLKNDVMEKVDFMDESTFLYCEEEILAERLLKLGYTSYYCSETSIVHMESSTVKKEGNKLSKKRIEPIMKSIEIYLKKYRGFNKIQIKICQFVRFMILLKRG